MRQRDVAMEANVSRRFDKLRQELLTALSQKQGQQNSRRSLSAILSNMLQEAKHVKIAQEILLSLRFDGMESRKHTISGTHADTYEWIFSSSKNLLRQKGLKADFPGWLESGRGIFWITGYPGAGKSTLMKFVDNHPTTVSKLQKWASGFRLIKASHYFWVNGSSIQKSQAGLLRALCFEVLRQCPDLLPQLCEERWNAALANEDHEQEWGIAELERILFLLQTLDLKVHEEHVRFCFFVDGLDEYSGDYEELLENLRQLATSQHIKICAASRPWNLFEEALGQDPARMLTMQDLTNDDISTYVRDILERDENFVKLKNADTKKAEDIIEDVTKRANGVFLWVYLVMTQLQKQLRNGGDLDTMQSSLDKFPSDLDDYFRHMFDTIDIFQQRETAQIFRVCIRARQPLALIAFSVLDPDNPVTRRLEGDRSVEKGDIDKIQKKMHEQINLRGPDLLEIIQDGKYLHVTFTHRSVREFLTHNNMDTLFAERAGKEFDPLETLCHMSVLTLKLCSHITDGSHAKDLYYTLIDDVLDYAQDMELAESGAPYAELNRLEELLEREKNIASALNTNRNSPLLPLAVRRNLCVFIRLRADHGPGTLQPVCSYPDRPLLQYALPVFRLGSEIPPEFRPEMVRILLQNGSDPNTLSWIQDEQAKVERRASVWSLYLRTLHSLHKRTKTRPNGSALLLTTETIIESGAQYVPNCLTEDGNKGEREILEIVFGKQEASRLLSLRGQPVKHARTGSGTSTRPAWARANSKLRRLSLSSGSNAT